ncbi:hypothetical protein OEZ71_06150 [Defluviimonas sp. WL0050]|uniref:Cytochrome C oxidase assembly protein n=1 Tax=Albidovulum litorale TaxID=2984134 RepID=A0ABT2ZL68_9RHOB|nr:hypothetical protein [Defluviimonas sp. WL0050]MCV2871874.1 hypothetical protein [Defluviimonas sp. WL0050]
MAIRQDHEIHTRRKGRNLGLGLVLGALVALIFGLSVVKISHLVEGKLPEEEVAQ